MFRKIDSLAPGKVIQNRYQTVDIALIIEQMDRNPDRPLPLGDYYLLGSKPFKQAVEWLTTERKDRGPVLFFHI